MTKLTVVEGIGEAYAAKLAEAGVDTTEEYMAKTAKPKGRAELAEASGLSPKLILRWANMIDLYRIKGVGAEYADLLEAAGVDTVPELAQRNGANLHAKMVEVNEAKDLVRRPPTAAQVADWVAQAKELPRQLEY
jgi:predicted flap endonuclease-1-like 5' DNA nuclease